MSMLDGKELEATQSRDPVHQGFEDGKWYFYDESWAHRYGPYETEVKAREELDVYCRNILGLDNGWLV